MQKRKLVLLGWDAADWQIIHPLMDAGRMPHLRKLVDHGVSGNLQTLVPALSPMLWNTIATGRLAEDHGILGFFEPEPDSGKIRAASSTSRRVKAIWNILDERGLNAAAVNWLASHPAEPGRGVIVSNALTTTASNRLKLPEQLPAGVVHPPDLAATFRDLMVLPNDFTGHDLARFIPDLAKVDQDKDKHPLQLAQLMSQAFTTHAAATWILEHTAWDFLGVYLDFIDRGGHHFMQYTPPQMEGVTDEDFALYQHVMNSIYECHDVLLGRVLELAGPEATVMIISDHGFLNGDQRPKLEAGPEGWHRDHGIFVLHGPGIRRDELVFGANLMDITPTLLALYGLPGGEDMPGRVLMDVFEQPPVVERIASWESTTAAGGDRKTAQELLGEAWDSTAMLDQLAALGYVDDRTDDQKTRAEKTRQDQTFNLARSLLGAGKPAEAIPLLEELTAALPDNNHMRLSLGVAFVRSQRHADARRIAAEVIAHENDRPLAHLLLAEVEIAEGNGEAALAHLDAVENSPSLEANSLDGRVGRALLLLKRWKDAEGRFRRALARNPESGPLHRGLAMALWNQQKLAESAEAAVDAVGCDYANALGHFLLGRSLAQMGRFPQAEQALENCLRFQPGDARAQRWLTAIRERQAAQ
ncbi:MAG: alkaline phosphatase family protein [Bryobacterales bacterium]|nr:alkaline phosphatase family protein [Bryobacterales bacterium]